jgi:hypothetical protein
VEGSLPEEINGFSLFQLIADNKEVTRVLPFNALQGRHPHSRYDGRKRCVPLAMQQGSSLSAKTVPKRINSPNLRSVLLKTFYRCCGLRRVSLMVFCALPMMPPSCSWAYFCSFIRGWRWRFSTKAISAALPSMKMPGIQARPACRAAVVRRSEGHDDDRAVRARAENDRLNDPLFCDRYGRFFEGLCVIIILIKARCYWRKKRTRMSIAT